MGVVEEVMVGRRSELGLINAFLDIAAGGGAALVMFGEPGIGKTLLLDVAAEAASAAGTQVIRGSGVEFEAPGSTSIPGALREQGGDGRRGAHRCVGSWDRSAARPICRVELRAGRTPKCVGYSSTALRDGRSPMARPRQRSGPCLHSPPVERKSGRILGCRTHGWGELFRPCRASRVRGSTAGGRHSA
jgi:hypothetical protein